MMHAPGNPLVLTRCFVLIGLATLIAALPDHAASQTRHSIKPDDNRNPLPELISGYEFSPINARALQDDDFDNPAFKWVLGGERLWTTPEGKSQKSCASCHGQKNNAMRGKAGEYPKFLPAVGRVVDLTQRINLCRREKMGAKPWAKDSEDMLSMSAYLSLQSRDMPRSVRIDGQAKSVFETGRQIYTSRIGQFGMSCAMCHDKHYGKSYGGEVINQGHSNGYPAFQLSRNSFVSLHDRFSSCFRRMKAEPYASGSEEYVALELYLAWRGADLPMEAPAVRR